MGENIITHKILWSSMEFEELKLHGENKGGEDVRGPWDDEVILQSIMTRAALACKFWNKNIWICRIMGACDGIVKGLDLKFSKFG
jgi:hypothetical protein